MKSKQKVNQEDIELFRKSIGKVRPVVVDTAQLARPRKRQIKPRDDGITVNEVHADPLALPEIFTVTATDEIQFRRPGVQDKVFKKLKRGQLRVADELDLHGVTANKALQMLNKFMAQFLYIDSQSCIRIIHGKGYGSKDGRPVIKMNVQHWLQSNNRVLAYCSCTRSDGGTGAIYVLLKNSP